MWPGLFNRISQTETQVDTITDPSNYRPVSLTSNIVKIMERFINFQLLRHLLDNHLISPSQFGFLPKHSTTDQLCYLIHDLLNALDRKQSATAVFLDLEAAFDTVPHAAIRQKLPAYGIRGKLFKWVCNYLTGRSQAVRINDSSSEFVPVLSGVPQGSVIAPTLIIIFINDICDFTEIQIAHVSSTLPSCDTLIYADDTMLYSCSKDINSVIDSLNASLSSIETWSSIWNMRFSVIKTRAIFLSRSDSQPTRKLHFCGADLEFTKTHKHLGFTITSDLTYNAHVDAVCRKIGSQLFLLRQLRIKTKNRDILCAVYKKYIRPHFEYASPAWSALPGYLANKLESLQRRAIRTVLGLPYRLSLDDTHYAALGLSTLQSRRNLATSCFGYKLFSGFLPRIFSRLKPFVASRHFNTRQQDRLILPFVNLSRTSRFFDRSPIMFSVKLLNSLPQATWYYPDVTQFKSVVWQHHHHAISAIAF